MPLRACINCGEAYEGTSPYCSQMCRDEAKNTPGAGPNGNQPTVDTTTTDKDDDDEELNQFLPQHRNAARMNINTFRFVRS